MWILKTLVYQLFNVEQFSKYYWAMSGNKFSVLHHKNQPRSVCSLWYQKINHKTLLCEWLMSAIFQYSRKKVSEVNLTYRILEKRACDSETFPEMSWTLATWGGRVLGGCGAGAALAASSRWARRSAYTRRSQRTTVTLLDLYLYTPANTSFLKLHEHTTLT